MKPSDAAIYAGHVVHKRLRPKPHGLRYRVFTLLLNVDDIDGAAKRLRLFSHNRLNALSLFDADYGAGDGTPVGDIARACLRRAGRAHEGRTILLLTYPRIFGYVFNPLSVFYVYAPDGALETLIYEVSNTFGERKSYVVAAGDAKRGDVYAQSCAKEMFVSPFAGGTGQYDFRVTAPADSALVGVMLKDSEGALIKTHFRAERRALTDGALLRVLVAYPLLTLKVIAAIHYEALKLWLKGVPLTKRHSSPRYSSSPALQQNKRQIG